MLKRIKQIWYEDGTLEERAFCVVSVVGFFVVLISTIVTRFEGLSMFATIASFIGSLFFFLMLVLAYGLGKEGPARVLLCYFTTCVLIPVSFFACGGIDSGMPLYMLGGLFLIIPILRGRARIICLVISALVQVLTIVYSYTYMDGAKIETTMNKDLLTHLSLEARVLDMVCSVILVAAFIIVTTMLIFNSYHKEKRNNEALMEQLDNLSKKDELTGLYNRRELFRHFEQIDLTGEERYYIAMFDVDHFKRINDTYGHMFGDVALRAISEKLHEVTKDDEKEMAVRYGGEEFVLLLKDTDDDRVKERAERLRKDVEEIRYEEQPGTTITISGGAVRCKDFENETAMLSQADKLLYESKEAGRNRIGYGF
ncbi:MAG: GGDEF domain-containing protein [Lachnospiraceae bacterium]|nr:GGDEF domain-containing protein [Lachnospiraceae bacterium]